MPDANPTLSGTQDTTRIPTALTTSIHFPPFIFFLQRRSYFRYFSIFVPFYFRHYFFLSPFLSLNPYFIDAVVLDISRTDFLHGFRDILSRQFPRWIFKRLGYCSFFTMFTVFLHFWRRFFFNSNAVRWSIFLIYFKVTIIHQCVNIKFKRSYLNRYFNFWSLFFRYEIYFFGKKRRIIRSINYWKMLNNFYLKAIKLNNALICQIHHFF